ncbi:MAG TPA: 16S rRNA (guanine(527)-N(7))-methyltransferase RsmG [Flavitalea sp.]|nr:16S rRNA (guanine(527)-N(7))-methyltransferase RsmG [Flavitalea sp.]
MEKAKENLELITRYFSDFTPLQLQRLEALEGLYRHWNSMINVISRKDEDSLYEKHVLHSLSIAAVFDFRKGMDVLDLGTGGGFPGIPLAIYFPEVKFHLVDSIGKKIKVVQAIAETLELTNVSTQHTRVEEIRNRKFNVVVSRAVAPLGQLWKWSKPLLTPRPFFMPAGAGLSEEGRPIAHGLICLKGGDLSQEIAESGCRPRMMELSALFSEDFFKEKYILNITGK